MRHIATFEGPRVGLTAPYTYSTIALDSLGRVQLHYRAPGQKWDIGHSKNIPAGMTAEQVSGIMRQWVTGEIGTIEEYKALLPD